MSRIFASTLCLGSLWLGTTAWATNTVTVQSVTADPGETGVAVPIELTHDDTVGGFQVSLTYPSDVLQVTDVTQGDYGAEMSIFASEFGTAGEIEALAGAIGGSESLDPGSGTIVTVLFDVAVKATGGSYEIALQDATLTDAMGANLKVSTADGELIVTGTKGTDEGGDDSADDGGGADGEDEGGGTTGGGPDTGADGGDAEVDRIRVPVTTPRGPTMVVPMGGYGHSVGHGPHHGVARDVGKDGRLRSSASSSTSVGVGWSFGCSWDGWDDETDSLKNNLGSTHPQDRPMRLDPVWDALGILFRQNDFRGR